MTDNTNTTNPTTVSTTTPSLTTFGVIDSAWIIKVQASVERAEANFETLHKWVNDHLDREEQRLSVWRDNMFKQTQEQTIQMTRQANALEKLVELLTQARDDDRSAR